MINKVKTLLIMLFMASFLVLSCENPCGAEAKPESRTGKTLSSLDVISNPTKILYIAGEKFEPAGMRVVAGYDDGTEKELNSGEFTYSPTGELTQNNRTITVSYKDGNITKSTEIDIKMGYRVRLGDVVNGKIESDVTRGAEKDIVTVTVTPDEKYELGSLFYTYKENSGRIKYENFELEEGVNEYKFDMPAYDVEVKATFKLKGDITTYSVQLDKVGAADKASVYFEYDEIGSELELLQEIPEDKKISFRVFPEAGYVVPEIPILSYNNKEIPVTVEDSDTGRFSFIMPAANVVLKIMIKEIGTYKLTTLITGGDGTVELKVGEKSISHETFLAPETEVEVIVKAADGYEITYVKFNGEDLNLDENGQAIFEMSESDAKLEVMFAEKQGYQIITGSVSGGTLKFSHILAKAGTTVVIMPTPDSDHVVVEELKVTNLTDKTEIEVKENNGNYSFVMPESSVSVSATFRGYMITILDSVGGKVVSDKKYAKVGEKITLTTTADEKKALGTVEIKDGETYLANRRTDKNETVSEITFTMPSADVTVSATFGTKIKTQYAVSKDGGFIELHQGKTYVVLTQFMYFAEGTEIMIETTPTKGNPDKGEAVYDVGSVKIEATNNKEDATTATKTAENKYSFKVPERDICIKVDFAVANAKRVYITKDFTGGTVVVVENGKTVTSSSESWLGGEAYIIENHELTVSATADIGYKLKTLTYNGTVISNGGTFVMPAEPVEIKAVFEKDTYALNFNSSVANGTFTVSSDFAYDESTKTLSAAGTVYKSGDEVGYDEVVYIIAKADSSYTEQVKVRNETEGGDIEILRMDKVTKPYQFRVPASAVTVNVAFEYKASDINLWVNGKAVANFTLNPTPDTKTWPTLDKEYYIESKNAEGYTQMGYPLKKGEKVQIKDKSGKVLDHWEGALGFDKDNPNYEVATATYIVEEDGIYSMYYKIWNEKDGSKGYSQWITIPKVGALANANYYLVVNGKTTETFAVSATLDPKQPTLFKQFYLKNVPLQKGDAVIVDSNVDPSAMPSNGILHWQPDNEVGAEDGKTFKVPASGEYDFYFKVWQDGGTSIWVQKSTVTK